MTRFRPVILSSWFLASGIAFSETYSLPKVFFIPDYNSTRPYEGVCDCVGPMFDHD